MTKYQEYSDTKFEELKKTMATKDCIKTLHETIKNQSERIEVFESKIAIMEKYITDAYVCISIALHQMRMNHVRNVWKKLKPFLYT